ncbi:hypothetical protein [Rhizobium leguminosarum]|uniref:hypothetical protein n=1 Tax=Rhizobium leguminosarum TaxID=384 RepID=UPI003F983F09
MKKTIRRTKPHKSDPVFLSKNPAFVPGFFIGTFSRLPRLSYVIADCSSGNGLNERTAVPSMFDEERIMPFLYCPSGKVKKQVRPSRLTGT